MPTSRACASSRPSAAGRSLPIALLADYALFHLEADLRWIEVTAARAGDLGRIIPPLLSPSTAAAETSHA